LIFSNDNQKKSKYATVIIDLDHNNSSKNNQKGVDKLKTAMKKVLENSNVEKIQPIYAYKTDWSRNSTQDTPDDYNLNFQSPSPDTINEHWYYDLEKTREMWQDQDCNNGGANCGGSSDVVVAVLDTGLAFEDRTASYNIGTNPLEPNSIIFGQNSEFDPTDGFHLYTNTAETNCTDGLDDDFNGYVDDCHGYNAYEDWICYYYDNNVDEELNPIIGDECSSAERSEAGHPNDDYGHGTFVTGGIASNVDNLSSSISPAFNVTILPIKVSERILHSSYPAYGPTMWSDDICNGIWYAIDAEADIINMSLGMPGYDEYLDEYCLYPAYDAGITLVAASGNDSSNELMSPVSFPANLNYVIAVG